MTPYDLVPIKWDDSVLYVRPVEWDGDPSTDENVMPTKYESSCAKCGNMIHIEIAQNTIKCEMCGAHIDNPLFVDNEEAEVEDPVDDPHETYDDGPIDDPVEGVDDMVEDMDVME
jgi:hypothetical protein